MAESASGHYRYPMGNYIWAMTLGALGLIARLWLNINWFSLTGLILHALGSMLLVIVIKPLFGDRCAWMHGTLHMLVAYVRFFLPLVVAPMIVACATDFTAQEVADSGGPILALDHT